MRYNQIEKLIENIELKYTTILNDTEIEKLSGINATDIKNEFVQITNITFDKYVIRRSLTLIINRIKDNKSKISSEDLSPWNSVQSFSKAFNNEFNIRPRKFLINYDEAILQNKIDIKKIELEENEIVEKVNYIMNKCNNNKISALKYFYTLKPYILPFPYTLARGIHFYKSSMNHLECISILTNEKDQEFIDMVIRANYGIKIKGEINYLGDVPQEYKINELENIERFYNLKEAVKFNYKNLKLYMVFNMYITPDRRILNKLINQLNNGINSTEFVEKPTEVTTILGEYLNKRNIKEKEIISLENDLLCLNLDTTLKNKILECIILQDKGFERFESFYKLFCTIKYNCRECNVRKSCDYSGECENSNRSNIKNKSKNFDKITIINFLEEFFELIWQRVLYLK